MKDVFARLIATITKCIANYEIVLKDESQKYVKYTFTTSNQFEVIINKHTNYIVACWLPQKNLQSMPGFILVIDRNKGKESLEWNIEMHFCSLENMPVKWNCIF